jgi:hypothetical protein
MAATIGGSLQPKYAGSYRAVSLDDLTPYKEWCEALPGGRASPRGERIPDHLFPKRIQFTKGKRLFDYNSYAGFPPAALSTRLKDLIESIEPGVHQFAPVEVLHKDGSPYGETFWFYNILTVIDAINPVKGGVYKQPRSNFDKDPDAFVWTIKSGGDGFLAVYKDRVAGRAMWLDKRFYGAHFFSDALLEGMRAQEMEGWEVETYWEEI